MLTPSTITARRTRRYTSTLYIRRTIHRVGYDPYGWRRVVHFATALCQQLPARTAHFNSAPYIRPKSYWSAPLYGEPTVQARRHRRRWFVFLAPFQLARMLPPMDISDNEEQSWKSNTRRQTRRNLLNSSGLLTFHPPATNCSGDRQTKPKSGTLLLDVAEKIGKMQRIRLQALARSGSRQRMLVVMAEDVPVCWLFWASSSARKNGTLQLDVAVDSVTMHTRRTCGDRPGAIKRCVYFTLE